ncbi:transposase family protein [Chroococcidiopsis sp.]|uniref:transposase family protein n=1 Tax=Chroococcidiopsis sp. TaxID=3088168 RepID=UPI003F333817
MVTLEYWREYRTQFHIATRDFGGNNSSRNSLTSWGLHETTVGRIIKKVEDLLVKCGKFRLPSKRHLYQPGYEWKVLVIDASEMEIERPQKNKNAITVANTSAIRAQLQLVVEWETGQIVCIVVDKGRTHDFKLFKRSRMPLRPSQLCLADQGYQGLSKLHRGACTPTKKPRKQSLPMAEKHHNRALAKLRVRVEHTIRRFKIFRIFSGRYRNRRKRFGLRLNLIAGLLNYELAHAV